MTTDETRMARCPREARARGRRWLGCASMALALGATTAVAPSPASASELRFSTTAPGGIVATGNTLGLSKALNENGPGTRDSIGTFLTLGAGSDDTPANPLNPWPAGTTWDWHLDGSAAELVLPSEVQILYAELIWGGGYQYVDDVSANLNDSVKLGAGGPSIDVSPAAATALTLSETAATNFAVRYYMRSADVTAFVQAQGSGTYEVRGVPATQNEGINSLNAAGWTLVVAYRDSSQPIRNLSIFVGGSFVDEDSQEDYAVSGFCAPPSGPVGGKVAISAIEGDANLVGDQLLIAPTVAGPFVNLAGPNNPVGNFFCSQLNDDTGALDTSGTFGSANQDALAGVNIAGGRQGWDVTAVPLSSADGQLFAGQTTAVLRTITTGDSFVPTLAAFEIDVNAPDFGGASTLATSTNLVALGDGFTLTATLDNQGAATASGVSFRLPLPAGLSLVSFTTDGAPGDVNGAAVSAADLVNGVDEGTLAPGSQRTVVLDVDVVGPPAGSSFFLPASWDYAFVTCQGEPPLTETYGDYAVVQFDPGSGGAGGAGASGGSGAGGSGATGGAGGAGNSFPVGGGGSSVGASAPAGPSGDDSVEAGCGCELPGRGGGSPLAALGAALLGLGMARARRRHERRR